jgi:TRAP-type C4-dicarboxylate transport system substrate-binding protein
MNMRKLIARMITTLSVLAVAACSAGAPADRAGGETVTLKLGTIDHVNPDGQSFGVQAFVDNIPKVSDGRLKVEVVEQYGDGAPTADADLIKAIADGKLDGGWMGTRGFGAAGIHGLEAFEAPMVITTYAAQKALVSSDVANQAFSALDQSGVVGLGLTVGPLRRPFAAKSALVGPEDWNGINFRTYNSDVQADTVKTLGAVPVNLGYEWIDEVSAGQLRGAEFHLAQYQHNGLGKEAGNVTGNVVLWPKMYVLTMSQKKFDALNDKQRAWIREAADRGVRASVEATYDESSIAQELCTRGVRFKDATPAQLLALRTRLAPVLDRLAADPESGPLLTTIKAVAAEYPQSETLRVDSDCRQGASTGDDRSAGAVPRTAAAIPDGVYRVQISTEEVLAAGQDNHDGTSGTWTLSVRHGRFELRCQPVAAPGDDCGGSTGSEPLEWGALRGKGNVVYFVSDTTEPLKAVRWAIKSNELQFTNPEHSGSWDSGIGMLVLKPWQKIE